jgi:sugar lactone lactonase YvrE
MKSRRISACIGVAVLLLVGAILIGCGSSSRVAPTKYVLVSDSENNRVLLYPVPITTGESATVVLGQPDLTSSGIATTAAGMDYPTSAVGDGNGNIWVADLSNCRVTEYKPPFTNGMAAALVIGQADMTSSTCAVSATALYGPSGLTFDGSGNLWVTDYDASRVLEYKPPFTSGMAASVVIGEPDMNTSAGGTSATTLLYPWQGIAFDKTGNLWIQDYSNSRVLGYQPPFTTGMAASVVIGQADMTSNVSGTTATTMDYPWGGLTFDSAGNLWVGDPDNDRVLQFTAPLTTGMAASAVLGQTDMTSSGSATTAAGLYEPSDVAFDSSGNLYVSDYANSRTVMYPPPFTTGMSATKVLGQTDLTSSTCNTTAAGQCYAYGVGTTR